MRTAPVNQSAGPLFEEREPARLISISISFSSSLAPEKRQEVKDFEILAEMQNSFKAAPRGWTIGQQQRARFAG
jgi:hypothetical protein